MNSDRYELAAGELSAKRVLFVEDNVTMRELMSAYARMLGAETIEVGSAEEALLYFAAHSTPGDVPDLVVVDIELPGLNGIALCERLSQTRGYPAERVIVVTGTVATDDLRRTKALGVRRMLLKPFLLEDFRDALCFRL